MINSIIEEISTAIKEEFGSRYTNYTEEAGQDLRRPCFFIFCLKSANKLLRGKEYFRTNQFCIRYFPEDSDNKRRECNETAERLITCLEWLTICGKRVMGTKMEYEMADNVLHFYVNYDMCVYQRKEVLPKIEELEADIAMKG